jgi:hypothetical protein
MEGQKTLGDLKESDMLSKADNILKTKAAKSHFLFPKADNILKIKALT